MIEWTPFSQIGSRCRPIVSSKFSTVNSAYNKITRIRKKLYTEAWKVINNMSLIPPFSSRWQKEHPRYNSGGYHNKILAILRKHEIHVVSPCLGAISRQVQIVLFLRLRKRPSHTGCLPFVLPQLVSLVGTLLGHAPQLVADVQSPPLRNCEQLHPKMVSSFACGKSLLKKTREDIWHSKDDDSWIIAFTLKLGLLVWWNKNK